MKLKHTPNKPQVPTRQNIAGTKDKVIITYFGRVNGKADHLTL